MVDPRGFMKLKRVDPPRRPVPLRVLDWREFYQPLPEQTLRDQGARCMDCGVPFCQGDTGCPVQNLIPEWNELVVRGRWREALTALHQTNRFPEFTGRLCPAPCEAACVLGLIDKPVTIKSIEQAIIDRGFEEGWVTPQPPARETGRRVAIVGSGPAGLAAAQTLRRIGHGVVVFEKDDRIGGLMRYGIPDFKMEREVLDRRLEQLYAEGIDFRTGVEVGRDISIGRLRAEFDAVLLATGAQQGREMNVPGRELHGIHMAMDYLVQQNRRVAGDRVDPAASISAEGKRVVVIGGGDTGSDCIGTAHRQGALEVIQLVLYPAPPLERDPSTPWPYWPLQFSSSHAHEEGGRREWSVLTRGFSGENGHVRKLHLVRVDVQRQPVGRPKFIEVPGSECEIEADLVVLAIGFSGPTGEDLYRELAVERDARGSVIVDAQHRTKVEGVFAAGDLDRGASLIVWAIREGQDAARAIDDYLAARSNGQPALAREAG
jgi:glutamate synthase (NADPH) small chain